MTTKVAKITISLSEDLLAVADRIAQECSKSRSGVIADLLKKAEKERINALMKEGYREMAEENLRLAEESFPETIEMMKRYTVWDEEPHG